MLLPHEKFVTRLISRFCINIILCSSGARHIFTLDEWLVLGRWRRTRSRHTHISSTVESSSTQSGSGLGWGEWGVDWGHRFIMRLCCFVRSKMNGTNFKAPIANNCRWATHFCAELFHAADADVHHKLNIIIMDGVKLILFHIHRHKIEGRRNMHWITILFYFSVPVSLKSVDIRCKSHHFNCIAFQTRVMPFSKVKLSFGSL